MIKVQQTIFSKLAHLCKTVASRKMAGKTKPRKILIDLDTGIDDAQALVMALSQPKEVDVVGVTCVDGNTELTQTCYNTLRILDLCGRLDVSDKLVTNVLRSSCNVANSKGFNSQRGRCFDSCYRELIRYVRGVEDVG